MDDLCAELLSSRSRTGFDPSPAVTRAVTNVVCTLVFGASYRQGDAELHEVIQYNNGIVQTIARGGLVDIYPWLKVRVLQMSQNVLSWSLIHFSVFSKMSRCLCRAYVHQVFPNKDLSKLKECIVIRDRLLTRKLEEHKVRRRGQQRRLVVAADPDV